MSVTAIELFLENNQLIYYIIDVFLLVILLKEVMSVRIQLIPRNLQAKNPIVLIFDTNKKRTKYLLNIMQLVNIPRYSVSTVQSTIDGDKSSILPSNFPFSHLIALHHTIDEFVYEIHIHNQHTTIQFSIPMLFRKKKERSNVIEIGGTLKAAFKTIYPASEIKFLTKKDLIDGYIKALGGIPESTEIQKDTIVLLTQDQKKVYLGVLKIEEGFHYGIKTERTPIDILIDGFSSENINASFFVFVKAMHKRGLIGKKKKISKEHSRYKDNTERNLHENKRLVRDDEFQEEMLKETTGLWGVSIYCTVVSENLNKLNRDLRKAYTVIVSALASQKYKLEVRRLKNRELQEAFLAILIRYIKKHKMKISSIKLASLIHFPEEIHPGINRSEVPKFELPSEPLELRRKQQVIENLDMGDLEEKNAVLLGYALWHEKELKPIYIPVSDLQLHTIVLGESGFGKTFFVKNLIYQLTENFPEIDWLIFDYKGEYLDLSRSFEDIKIFTPGDKINGLKINIFDAGVDSLEMHKQKLFLLLYERISKVFKKSEYTPQMERCLKEAIAYVVDTYRIKNGIKKKPFELLFEALDRIAEEKKKNMPTVVYSVEGIKSRLDRFKTGILGNIFNSVKPNAVPKDFSQGKVIINLQELIRAGATASEIRFVMAIIFKYILDYALRRNSQKLQHITIVEEANILIPKSSETDEGIFETAVLNVRSLGEGLIFVAQRPNISENILVNTGTKILFRNPWEANILANYINLDKVQEDYLRTIPIGEAIAMVPHYPYPFRIRTTKVIQSSTKSKSKLRPRSLQKLIAKTKIPKSEFNDTKEENNQDIETLDRDVLFEIATKILESEHYTLIKRVLNTLKQKDYTLETLQAILSNIDHETLNFVLRSLERCKPALVQISSNNVKITRVGQMVNELLIDEIEIEA